MHGATVGKSIFMCLLSFLTANILYFPEQHLLIGLFCWHDVCSV